MYPKKECVKREEGKHLNQPAATLLPFRKAPQASPESKEESSSDSSDSDDDSYDEPDAGSARTGGKGKGKAGPTNSTGEGDMMDVDEEPLASNVIALNGVDSQVTSLMFRAFAADALYAVRARPLGMVHGQGRMWVRFESITEARRAFGALIQMNGELAGSYEPDGAFHDAYTYSRDRWTVQTTDNLVAENPPVAPMEVNLAPPAVSVASAIGAGVPARGSSERFLAAQLPTPAPPADPSTAASSRSSTSAPTAGPPLSSPAQVTEPPFALRATATGRVDERPSAASPSTAPPAAPRSTPLAPRSMIATERAFRRLTLSERLADTSTPTQASELPSSRGVSLAERLTTPLADHLSDPVPLAQRLGPLKESATTDRALPAAPKRARAPASEASDEPPARKKVRRGKRAGRQTREQEEIRARFRAEAEAMVQRADETNDPELLAWVPTLELAAEMEVDEEEARALWLAAEDDDMDISPAVAGPSSRK
ncbi:hypothetical protein B0H15DRAFT_947146 [Mycena belliarum]|uniref:Uncharacterized protein n=1 Tax=Mycena belliarum TaxID=1033014 RepID=A0AAD6UB81_9AGAR|nr:hypothetical protein B0H15DRAFT_947146 [Mycena belliae]